ncbi:hypothetical protein JOQ06_010458 [Pogonophryne albipinna]|uniref:Uncharacterized protein n=1 Tax=Pogonophryne albipinna TaxID=1090488 RepID=A0AAD6AW63_9TELE|nr:hypothetical protein JOQ06_010458 [Pogonophryne albipinna]
MCLQTSYFPDDHTGEIIAPRVTRLAGLLEASRRQLHNAIMNGMKDPRIDRAIGVCKKVLRKANPSGHICAGPAPRRSC